MAVYKVIQDIEAEDRILGPLTLKAFIYFVVAVLLGFVDIRLVLLSGLLVPLKIVVSLFILPPMLLLLTLASPLGREQPTEVWLLSRIRFLIKPRKRIWNQSGLLNLVTITAPKKFDKVRTKDLSQNEVNSRLQALAMTLDSRGWSIKNADVNIAPAPEYVQNAEEYSDRLVAASALAEDKPVIDVRASDDIMDPQNNATAQNFEIMMEQAEAERKRQAQAKLEAARLAQTATRQEADDPNILTDEEKDVLNKIHADEAKLRGQHAIIHGYQTDGSTEVTGANQTVKLELSNAGNALTVASIAELANRPPNQRIVPLNY